MAASWSTTSPLPSCNVGVVCSREPAPAGDEILVHHDVMVTVGLGEPDSWCPHRDLSGQVAVEARFGDAHSRAVDELSLLLAERRELHEYARRNAGVTTERGARVPSFRSCE